MTDQSVQTRARRVMILRQILLGTLVPVLVFVPDDQLAIRVTAGIVVIAVFWLPPVVGTITNFREGYRGGWFKAASGRQPRLRVGASARSRLDHLQERKLEIYQLPQPEARYP